jgi:hypothetical protein
VLPSFQVFWDWVALESVSSNLFVEPLNGLGLRNFNPQEVD